MTTSPGPSAHPTRDVGEALGDRDGQLGLPASATSAPLTRSSRATSSISASVSIHGPSGVYPSPALRLEVPWVAGPRSGFERSFTAVMPSTYSCAFAAVRPRVSRPMTTATSPSATVRPHRVEASPARPRRPPCAGSSATPARAMHAQGRSGRCPRRRAGSQGASGSPTTAPSRSAGGRARGERVEGVLASASMPSAAQRRAPRRHRPSAIRAIRIRPPPSCRRRRRSSGRSRSRDAPLARNTSAPTRSSTSPQRPAGVRPRTHAENGSSSTSACVSSVAK